MSEYQAVEFHVDERQVAMITLARPQKHNAINSEMVAELTEIASKIHSDKSIRVCVLQAQGQTFCAGGDLEYMQSQMALERDVKIAEASKITAMLSTLDDLPCPLIGKIQGPAYGGGIGLMAICDVVIAADNARFALTETKLGLIPAIIGPFVIRRIGEAWARQYFFSSKPFDVEIAAKMNLVSSVVAISELDDQVENEIMQFLKCLPGAVSDAKAFAKQLARNPSMETGKFAASRLADRWEAPETRQAIKTFLSK